MATACFVARVETRDFLFLTEELSFDGGTPETPQPGDLIDEEQCGTVFTYEVRPMGSEAAWRYSDSFRIARRIHTKLIQTH